MKIVSNGRCGGFGLSQAGHYELGRRLGLTENDYYFSTPDAQPSPLGLPENDYYSGDIKRTNSDLVEMIEENASLYSGDHAQLYVVEVPDDVEWYIHDYDGREHVAEKHRTWQ